MERSQDYLLLIVIILYHTVLIGYGNTPSCNGCNKVDFMVNVFDNILGASVRPVIVSPSMSGSWSLPFIKEHQGNILRYF